MDFPALLLFCFAFAVWIGIGVYWLIRGDRLLALLSGVAAAWTVIFMIR